MYCVSTKVIRWKRAHVVWKSTFNFWAAAHVAWIYWDVQKWGFLVDEISLLRVNGSVSLRKRSDMIPAIVFAITFSFVQMSLLIENTM